MNTSWKTRSLLTGSFVLALAAATVFGASTRVQADVRKVAGKVSYLVGRGGNIGVFAGDDGVLMIDDQFANVAAEIEEAVKRESNGRLPNFLVNTHHHGDHTGGNAYFGKHATILAHANVRERLKNEGKEKQALPVVTYEDGLSLFLNGEEVRLFHVKNAHTDGDTIVWFRGSNVFHLGDCYFQLGYPFIDVNSGGSVQGLIAAIKHVLELAPKNAQFIPGHGEVTGRKGLEEYVEMLETLSERVKTHLSQGDTIEAMLKVGVTEDYDERWGGFNFVPPRRMVESIAASFQKEK